MELSKKEERLIKYLDHFHPESLAYGGWPLNLEIKDIEFVKKNFKNLEIKDDRVRLKNDNFTSEQTLLLLKYQRDMYQEAYFNLHEKIGKILDEY